MPNSLSSHAVAQGSNRLNSQGVRQVGVFNRTSQFWTQVVPAGQTLVASVPGSTFVVTYCSLAPSVRPNPSGSFNTYQMGTGLDTSEEGPFVMLEVANPYAVDILVQLFIGFDGFIDHRLILDQSAFPQVAYPTYPTANAAAAVAITDKSGTKFTDINGKQWYAVSREGIYISNIDAGVTLLLQHQGSVVSNGPAVAAVYPTTTLRYPSAGNFSLSVGGGNINAIVSEIYFSLAA
jgi:hypothetical protein